MDTEKQRQPHHASSWVRIPNGTKVRHRHESYDGVVDGLTEIVEGPQRNPDGKTQYRINIGPGSRQLVSEDNLSILLDSENLVIIGREKEPYRRSVTTNLRAAFSDDRFIKSA